MNESKPAAAPGLRAVGYTRVSTEDQATRLADDRVRITAACVAYNYNLIDFIEDPDVSGKIALGDRPNGRRIDELIDARHPWADVIIVTNLDRLTRESEDGMTLIKRMVPTGRRNPVVLVSLDDHIDLTTAMGRFFARLRVLLGEFERELIGERTGFALRHKRRTGQVYARLPYGWDRAGDGLVKNETEQAVIARMREWRARGVNDNAIAGRLNAGDVPGKLGGRWQANTVYRTLRIADEIGTEARDVTEPARS